MLNLTDVERRILINQSRILAALYPLEQPEFEHAVEILCEGYHEAWQDVVLRGLKAPYLKENMNFVYQVLGMYDWLQKSFYALSFEDKLQLKEHSLVFPGFDPRTERRDLAYATFLIRNLDRFAFVEVAKPLTAFRPMREIYEEMLKGLPGIGADLLPAAQLKRIITYIAAIKTPAVQAVPAQRRAAR